MVSIKGFLERLSAIFGKRVSPAVSAEAGPEPDATAQPLADAGDVSRETLAPGLPDELPETDTPALLSEEVTDSDGSPLLQEIAATEHGAVDAADLPAETAPEEVSAAAAAEAVPGPPPAAATDAAAASGAPKLNSRVIVVINQKGGVGKTTTAINLAAALAAGGRQVLLIDADPQGNAGSGLGIDRNKLGGCLYDLLIGALTLEAVRVETLVPGLEVVPATVNLAGAEVELVTLDNREYRLGTALQNAVDGYDFVIIDCPPSLGLLTINALAIADEVLIPVQCEFFALEGLGQLYATLNLVRKELNPHLRRQHILINMYDGRVKLHQQVKAEIAKFFQADLLKTEIPRSVRLSEAPSFGQPIEEYDKNGWLSDIYRRLAGEVVGFE